MEKSSFICLLKFSIPKGNVFKNFSIWQPSCVCWSVCLCLCVCVYAMCVQHQKKGEKVFSSVNDKKERKLVLWNIFPTDHYFLNTHTPTHTHTHTHAHTHVYTNTSGKVGWRRCVWVCVGVGTCVCVCVCACVCVWVFGKVYIGVWDWVLCVRMRM